MDKCARNSEIPHDTVISIAQQESVVLLLKHCQEMKRQESRLRLVTLFLVLGCAAVFVFTQRVNRDCNEKDSFKPAEYSRQQAIDRQEQNLKPNAHLTTSSRCNSVPEVYIQWEHQKTGLVHMQHFTYDEKKHALVVPQGGRYFVYVGVNFRMPDKDKVSGEIHFLSLKVWKFSNRYPDDWPIMEVKDSIPDNRRGARTVYTGQVVALEEGDLLRVSINEDNYELIDCSAETTMYIGAFLL
ncbi:tumor necrosis factor ligand superfamily member 15 [Salvelinus fontinalis]|uniref:tumor necrosis factor ligand superfamily member 15 n=1 Tax=Salvelinus fontinalis TaxID=8038 RepID=UPI002486389A|nr:tumor necrosis factor ligand superfamily member 15 [Salvelinus fontinalis]